MAESLCVGGPLHGQVVDWPANCSERRIMTEVSPGVCEVYVREAPDHPGLDPFTLWRHRLLTPAEFRAEAAGLLLTPLARRLLGT